MARSSYLPVSTQDVDEPTLTSPTSTRGGPPTAHMATTTLRVGGMTCGACTSAVEGGFADVDGVGNVTVSLIMERAVVQHDPTRITPDEIKEMIEDRGFDADVLSTDTPTEDDGELLSDLEVDMENERLSTTTVSVGGMTCGACTSAVEGAFKNVPGLQSFSISLLSERAVLQHNPTILSPEQIIETIEDAGFEASIVDTQTSQPTQHRKTKRRRDDGQKVLTTTIAIEGMTCGACTSAVEGGFSDVDGLIQFNISLLAERAVLLHDPTKLSPEKIVEIIEGRGFDAKIISSTEGTSHNSSTLTTYLKVYGLSNSKAASDLESSLGQMPGIISANLNPTTLRATITHRPATIGLRAIVEAVEAAGYNALVADSDDNNAQLESLAKTKEIQEWKSALWKSFSFALPVFLISMIFPMFLPFLDFGSVELGGGLWLGDVICMILTIPVQFGIGKRFYISAWKSIRHGSPTMDVLVVLGTSAAFFFSVGAMIVSVVTPPHTRPSTVFDTSSMLITFICIGRYLENRAKGQTSKALSRLMSLAPSMATIYADPIAAAKVAEEWNTTDSKEGIRRTSVSYSAEEKVVPTELIEVGDIVILKPGDKIPADGTVIRGESYIDESMVTGEAMPILKKKGHLLMAGTVNGAGRVDFSVTRAGRDTQLSQIVRLVQDAQTSRAPIQQFADVVAGYFVSVIITLGAATFIAWMILSHVLPNPPSIFLEDSSGGKVMVCMKLCISVIVFACPCALGLSTPTAVMVGTGVGAEKGILIKGGAALETATKITHVVFDKTGTLTVGKMSVSRSHLAEDWMSSESRSKLWWTLIGLAEMNSEHPIAKAIVLTAKERLGLGPDGVLDGSVGDFEAVVGKGIGANVDAAISPERKRHHLLIGNASFLKSHGIIVPESASSSSASSETSRDPSRANSPSRETPNATLSNAGTTTIHSAIDGAYAGSLYLSDTIKPSARATIDALRRLGIESSIVTGDQRAPALHVARQVGIPKTNVHAGASPADKQRLLAAMQTPKSAGGPGEVVAMVGDGINDSPALASASMGVALASGTDVAVEAASVVLMNAQDLLLVPAALHLGRAIFARIRLNLLWACGYNVVGLPFAMGFFLPWGMSLHPMAAGAAMACSSFSVVMSSLALRFWRRPKWMVLEVVEEDVGGKERFGVGQRPRGLLKRVKSWAGAWKGERRREREEEERGVYVPLRNFGDS